MVQKKTPKSKRTSVRMPSMTLECSFHYRWIPAFSSSFESVPNASRASASMSPSIVQKRLPKVSECATPKNILHAQRCTTEIIYSLCLSHALSPRSFWQCHAKTTLKFMSFTSGVRSGISGDVHSILVHKTPTSKSSSVWVQDMNPRLNSHCKGLPAVSASCCVSKMSHVHQHL